MFTRREGLEAHLIQIRHLVELGLSPSPLRIPGDSSPIVNELQRSAAILESILEELNEYDAEKPIQVQDARAAQANVVV